MEFVGGVAVIKVPVTHEEYDYVRSQIGIKDRFSDPLLVEENTVFEVVGTRFVLLPNKE